MPEMTAQKNTLEFSDNSVTAATKHWDQDSEDTPVFAVVSAVAEAKEVDALELSPLAEAINPEALNDLFTTRVESTVGEVSFQYAGYDVTVRGNGEVAVQAAHDV